MALLVPTYYSPGWQCHQISPFHSSTLPSAKCQVKLPIWHHTSQGQLLSVCLASWCLWNIVIYSLTVQAPSKLQIWDFSFLSTKSLPHRQLEFWIFFSILWRCHVAKQASRRPQPKPKTTWGRLFDFGEDWTTHIQPATFENQVFGIFFR